jgi:hypothetical protein
MVEVHVKCDFIGSCVCNPNDCDESNEAKERIEVAVGLNALKE